MTGPREILQDMGVTQDEFDPFEWQDDEDVGDECGRWDNGKLGLPCSLAGTEFCNFECPYRG